MNKHSPAPWSRDLDSAGDFGLIDSEGNEIIGGCGCCGSPSISNEEYNAPLIIAAPEMLDVLKIAQGYIEAVVFNSTNSRKRNNYAKCLHLINDVIAKAEGSDERSTG